MDVAVAVPGPRAHVGVVVGVGVVIRVFVVVGGVVRVVEVVV